MINQKAEEEVRLIIDHLEVHSKALEQINLILSEMKNGTVKN